MAFTYSKIATYVVGSGGLANVSFLNIPQNYTDLIVKASIRTVAVPAQIYADMTFLINNNTSSSYSWKTLRGTGSGTGSQGTSNNSSGYLTQLTGNGATANTFGNLEMYFYNYTSGNHKSFSADGVGENNATTAYAEITGQVWQGTDPITSFSFNATGVFAQYSTFHLYGIKAEL
jgi:hypothetical protein